MFPHVRNKASAAPPCRWPTKQQRICVCGQTQGAAWAWFAGAATPRLCWQGLPARRPMIHVVSLKLGLVYEPVAIAGKKFVECITYETAARPIWGNKHLSVKAAGGGGCNQVATTGEEHWRTDTRATILSLCHMLWPKQTCKYQQVGYGRGWAPPTLMVLELGLGHYSRPTSKALTLSPRPASSVEAPYPPV